MGSVLLAGKTNGRPGIAYGERGNGPPLIFLHGIGGNRHNWSEQVKTFSFGHRAIAWDARGYGDSDDYQGPCRFEDFSDDLSRLMDHLKIDQAHLVGLSMGGRILMDFGVRHPSRIRSLVIAGSFPSFGRALTPAQQAEFMRLRREPLEQGRSFEELAPQLVDSLVGPHASAEARQRMSESIAHLRVESYLKTLEATMGFDRTDVLANITAPTLLLYGEFDTLVTPEAGRAVQSALPHAEYRVIAEAGHLVNIERPKEFNAVVAEFLSRQPA